MKARLWWNQYLVIILVGYLDSVAFAASGDDYRLRRCASYRNLTLNGLRPDWVPYQDPVDPCSLRCQDTARGFRVLLEARVPDGTQCQNRTAEDVCQNGTCMSPGCDGRLGSELMMDRCGICGGNGSSCGSRRNEKDPESSSSDSFQWYHANYSSCSVSCGVGFQTAAVECRNRTSQTITSNDVCDAKTRPETKMRPCRIQCKRYVWVAGVWSDCSVTCGGGGVRQRMVFCAEELSGGSFERKSDALCTGNRPDETSGCHAAECPRWIAGQWSPCSSTCSGGIQTRPVVCRRSSGVNCPRSEKPISQRRCHSHRGSDVTCRDNPTSNTEVGKTFEQELNLTKVPGRTDSTLQDDSDSEENDSEHHEWSEIPGGKGRHGTRVRHRPKAKGRTKSSPTQKPGVKITGKKSLESSPLPSGRVEKKMVGEGGDDVRTEQDIGNAVELKSSSVESIREISTTPSFVVSSWGDCSATCGDGIRTRLVRCQVYDETNRTVRDLPDSSCSGPRPMDVEYCRLSDCYDEAVAESFAWTLTGYGVCSRSCAGGLQEATFACLRISDFTMMKNERCQHLPQPAKAPRPCNEHRCPTRWHAFPSGLCSASCGGGQQHRRVRCIYDDVEGGDAVEVDDDRCPPPKPPRIVHCNMAPCPPSWTVDGWSECSVTCGKGTQFRQVRCEQKVSVSTMATVNDTLCSAQPTPARVNKTCHRKDCPVGSTQSVIRVDLKSFSQLSLRTNKVPLLVGGTAVLIPGTTVLVTCSVRNFNRSLITWHRGRDGRELGRVGRMKVSLKGVLRIRSSRPSDAGVYTCRAGQDSASINISFTTELEARRLEQEKMAFTGGRGAEGRGGRRGDDEVRFDDDEEEPKHPISIRGLLKRFRLAELPLRFYPHPWSACSKTCGGSGLQSRDITCEVTMERGYTLVVNDSYCLGKGQAKPIETRDCGYGSGSVACPTWNAGPWKECSDEFCIRNGIGSRIRSTHCVAHNGSTIGSSNCSPESRPIGQEECPHENCATNWKASEWTTCSASCGGKGFKTRTIACVWNSTEKSAADKCDQLPRPEVTKTCFTPMCPQPEVCRDESKYCVQMPALRMCRFPQYRQECCLSCSLYSSVSSGHPQAAPQPLGSRHDDAV